MTGPYAAAARVAHGLALAACFGGTLFGKAAFNPAVGAVASKPERGKVRGNTWMRFNAVNAASFCVAVTTLLPGRLGSAGAMRVHDRLPSLFAASTTPVSHHARVTFAAPAALLEAE